MKVDVTGEQNKSQTLRNIDAIEGHVVHITLRVSFGEIGVYLRHGNGLPQDDRLKSTVDPSLKGTHYVRLTSDCERRS